MPTVTTDFSFFDQALEDLASSGNTNTSLDTSPVSPTTIGLTSPSSASLDFDLPKEAKPDTASLAEVSPEAKTLEISPEAKESDLVEDEASLNASLNKILEDWLPSNSNETNKYSFITDAVASDTATDLSSKGFDVNIGTDFLARNTTSQALPDLVAPLVKQENLTNPSISTSIPKMNIDDSALENIRTQLEKRSGLIEKTADTHFELDSNGIPKYEFYKGDDNEKAYQNALDIAEDLWDLDLIDEDYFDVLADKIQEVYDTGNMDYEKKLLPLLEKKNLIPEASPNKATPKEVAPTVAPDTVIPEVIPKGTGSPVSTESSTESSKEEKEEVAPVASPDTVVPDTVTPEEITLDTASPEIKKDKKEEIPSRYFDNEDIQQLVDSFEKNGNERNIESKANQIAELSVGEDVVNGAVSNTYERPWQEVPGAEKIKDAMEKAAEYENNAKSEKEKRLWQVVRKYQREIATIANFPDLAAMDFTKDSSYSKELEEPSGTKTGEATSTEVAPEHKVPKKYITSIEEAVRDEEGYLPQWSPAEGYEYTVETGKKETDSYPDGYIMHKNRIDIPGPITIYISKDFKHMKVKDFIKGSWGTDAGYWILDYFPNFNTYFTRDMGDGVRKGGKKLEEVVPGLSGTAFRDLGASLLGYDKTKDLENPAYKAPTGIERVKEDLVDAMLGPGTSKEKDVDDKDLYSFEDAKKMYKELYEQRMYNAVPMDEYEKLFSNYYLEHPEEIPNDSLPAAIYKTLINAVVKGSTGLNEEEWKENIEKMTGKFDKDLANTQAKEAYQEATETFTSKIANIWKSNDSFFSKIRQTIEQTKAYKNELKRVTEEETAAGQTAKAISELAKATLRPVVMAAAAALGIPEAAVFMLLKNAGVDKMIAAMMQYSNIDKETAAEMAKLIQEASVLDLQITSEEISTPEVSDTVQRYDSSAKDNDLASKYNKGLQKEALSDEGAKDFFNRVHMLIRHDPILLKAVKGL